MTESTPRVSIVLPTYNGASFLTESIQSCLDQTYTDWELIAVDDASSDDTPQILGRFAARDPRIHIIRHDQNKRLPGALNTGFRAARGDYLTWTSDDNLYRPHALQTLVEFLDAHPDTDVVYADYSLIDAQGQVIKQETVADPRALVYKSVVRACFLYRRAVHEALGGYAEDLFLAEDYDFWLRASAQFTLTPLHRDLYLYRAHGSSLTDQYRPQVMIAREQTIVRNLPHLRWADRSDRARAYLHLAELAMLRNSRRDARSYYLRALAQHPVIALRRNVRHLLDRVSRRRANA